MDKLTPSDKGDLIDEYVTDIINSMDSGDMWSYVYDVMTYSYEDKEEEEIKQELLDCHMFELYEKYFGPLPDEYKDE